MAFLYLEWAQQKNEGSRCLNQPRSSETFLLPGHSFVRLNIENITYIVFAWATMCFTPPRCDSAAATHYMDLSKESFVSATMRCKVISYRTAVSTYRAWSATTTTLLLCLLMEIPTKRRLFCCLGIGRWIYMSSFFQKVADKWLSKRAGWFIAHLWYRSYHTILGKHSENLKWKGTGLILIYICNDREDPSSYMNISTIKRQSLNQGKFEPLWDFFWKNWHCSIQNIWTMWNGKHW